MLMGSTRPKTHIRRTSSMRGLALSDDHTPPPPTAMFTAGHHHNQFSEIQPASSDYHWMTSSINNYNNPRRRNSDPFYQSGFLRTCGFCRRRLAAARDLYMYKGDGAFCSFECREEQMKRDGERIAED
uniref:FLZ-type domain-containing protein n=1 Tax=Kalanchoe fedtschenkoi TaxID=63787 RepID=A0A7N0ZSH8_KALFE